MKRAIPGAICALSFLGVILGSFAALLPFAVSLWTLGKMEV